jgi:DeoR/GlpR family transcriptional regulator of sugar metabolism
VLVDSSKLDRHALFQVCQADRLDRLVTDTPLPPSLADVMSAAGVEVIVAAG